MPRGKEYFNSKYIINNNKKDEPRAYRTYSDIKAEARPMNSLQIVQSRQLTEWDKLQRGILIDPIKWEDQENILLLRRAALDEKQANNAIKVYEATKMGKDDLTPAPAVVTERASDRLEPIEKAELALMSTMIGGFALDLLLLYTSPSYAGYGMATGVVAGLTFLGGGISVEFHRAIKKLSELKRFGKEPQPI
jgi:hypothetical protein